MVYIMAFALIQCALLSVSARHGDSEIIFIFTTFSVYVGYGVFFAIIPTLTSEYFGMHHFIRNWGMLYFINAVLTFVAMAIFGALYSSEAVGLYCYGLLCYVDFYIMSAAFTMLSFVLLLVLCVRQWSR